MGILLGFLLVCLIIYAIFVTNGVYFILKLVITNWMSIDISLKLLWSLINLVLWLISMQFIYFLLIDSKGGSPNMEGVWKFYMILSTILFLIVFLLGYKSK
jgi:hypothetical protein